MCVKQQAIYKMAYRAIRAYHSGQSTVNPLTALREMQDVLPYSVCASTTRAILLANKSFDVRHQAPKGVHEAIADIPAKDLTWLAKEDLGRSTLRKTRFEVSISASLRLARAAAYAHSIVHVVTPFERLDIKAEVIRKFLNLPLAA